MLSLMLAVLCSTAIALAMRLSTGRVGSNIGLLAMNYLTCFVIAVAFTGVDSLFTTESGWVTALGLGGAQGALYLLAFVLLQLNIRKNGVVLSAIFQRLGLLVPMVVSVFLFKEIPETMQLLGFGVAVLAIVLINLEKEQSVIQFKLGLVLILLAGGMADVMAKLYEEWGNPALAPQFLLHTFGVALVLSVGMMLWKKERPGWKELAYGAAVGVPNYFSAKFLLASLESVPAVIVYPTFSVATILLVTLAGVVLFKERLSKRQIIAIGVILLALVLLNM